MDPADKGGTYPDMSEAEFREAMNAVAEWMARYRTRVGALPVLSSVRPGEIEKALPQQAPAHNEPVEMWLSDLEQIILPGVTHWNHPGFMAYFGITASAPGILGECLSSVLNNNGMLWKTSPALTELEQVMMRWLAGAMGLPTDRFGMITDTASTSTLVALTAAREVSGLNVREDGLSGKPPLVLYCSQEAHSSVDKAGLVLGIGTKGFAASLRMTHFACAPTAWRTPSAGTLSKACAPLPSSPRSEPLRQPRWIRCRKSPGSAANTNSGSMWTQHMPARPPLPRNFAGP